MSTSIHTGSPGFREDFKNPEASSLDGDGGSSDFDWQGLSRALGECGEELDAHDTERLGSALREVLRWFVAGVRVTSNKSPSEMVGRRALALAWAVDPSLFEGSPSLSGLARRLGLHKVAMSKATVAVRDRFGITNRAQQSHDWRLRGGSRKKGGNDER